MPPDWEKTNCRMLGNKDCSCSIMQFCFLNSFLTQPKNLVQMFLWVTRTPSPIKIPLVTAHCHTELPGHEHDDGELFSEYLDRHELGPTSNHNGPQGDVALVESSSAIVTQWLRVLFGRDALSTKNGGTCCLFVFIPILWKTQGLLNDVQENMKHILFNI